MTTIHLQEKLEHLLTQYRHESEAATTEAGLRSLYARYGGKEGSIRMSVAEALRSAIGLDKKAVGQTGNAVLKELEALLEHQLATLAGQARALDLQRKVDVTLPGRIRQLGSLHPMTKIRRMVEGIFAELGFVVATGPQIETDFYNFQALAIPEHHPARSMQDTFYLSGETLLLRTHTSSVQIHTMLAQEPPIRIIAPGKVYRNEDDPRHSPMFSQLEGLVIDQGIDFADLKGTLLYFVRRLFGSQTKIRLRASFFPFVEPGAEVDIICYFCQGTGGDCRTCKGSGFIEVLGCGLVNPQVFEEVNQKLIEAGQEPRYEAQRYPGFAFGMGLDRLAMLYYGVNDLKLFFSGDLRLQEQLRRT